MEPDGKPAALETGMTSYKNSFAFIEIIKNVNHVGILLYMFLAELIDALNHPSIHLGCHSGIYANPEGVVHHEVGILQISYLSIALATLAHLVKCVMLDKITCKEVAGLNLVIFEVACKFITCKTGIVLDCNKETEP